MTTSPTDRGGWQFWIDQGGTFTDVIALSPAGELHVTKLLSDDPGRYRHAPVEAIRRRLGLSGGAAIPPEELAGVRMGTTKATNALLERRGEPFALLVTAGLEDVLEIGYQERPDIFALAIEKPSSLPARVVGIQERLDAAGDVLLPLDRRGARRALEECRAAGLDSVAIVLLHAWRNPAHEEELGELARQLGFSQVSLSHRVAREIKVVGRGDTTCVDAYLTPVLRRYLDDLAGGLPDSTRVFMMQSNGGLAGLGHFTGKNAVLSGPAGGVVACARIAREAGVEKVIGLDMGGTSTDVCRFDGSFDRVFETRIAGVRLKAPMLDIVTVASGGGSRLRFETGRFTVGPDSAGADPGPSCYGKRGPLAVTDANLVLGRLQPAHFPRCFGEGGDAPLDVAAAREAMARVARRVREVTGRDMSPEEVAQGFVRVANEAMAEPIKEVSVARGYDVREYTLVGFGGAAGQHVGALARALGIRRVLLHPLGGVLSAYGIGLADVVREEVRAVLVELGEEGLAGLEPTFSELDVEVRAALAEQDVDAEALTVARSLDLRYRGVDQSLEVPVDPSSDAGSVRAAFEEAHERLFGFLHPDAAVEVVNLRVQGRGNLPTREEPLREERRRDLGADDATEVVETWFPRPDGTPAPRPTPVFLRHDLTPGDRLEGPALVIEETSTLVIDPGFTARVTARDHLLLEDREGATEELSTARDPITLELFDHLFMSCAEQMGRTLEKVSHSTNIKERLDFSCAVFDRRGQLIANAPHIPVHLGAMGATVRAVLEAVGDGMRPGDVYASNDPYHGGSHLPDVTVVTPVFSEAGELRFFVANRGHHADIGGITPGSMPPFSQCIEEEGVRLHGFLLVRDGELRERELVEALRGGTYPARNLPERLSDLRAQVAANRAGVGILGELCDRLGFEVVEAYMGHMLANGEEAVRELLASVPDGTHRFTDFLDDGARVDLAIEVEGDEAVFDFTGSDDQRPGNLNAPRAVVEAAVLYVLRCLTHRTLPLNSGCLRPVTLRTRPGSLLDPRPPAAVVGGNVETSQRIVDVLLGALGRLAASQGTMNNLTFGTEDFGYYETLCGGAGAGLGFDGADAVHTHMTNTRITDPEVIEHRYPVRVRRFAVRRGSGGAGVYRGGDGVVRELEFLRPMKASLLSERRGLAPFGLNGAAPGRSGRGALLRGRRVMELPGKVRLEVEPGDVLRIETPGGGGYEPTPEEWAAMAPAELRRLCRLGRFDRPTSGVAAGRVQANLLVLPAAHADAFERFCAANPRACPLLERLPPGDPFSRWLAPGADLRTDLPRYRLHGPEGAATLLDLCAAWREDAVAFLLGCSFSFEGALVAAGLGLRHVEEGVNVPMYRTDRPLAEVGPFGGSLVVSMRPFPPEQVEQARRITAAFPRVHGAPLHAGDPAALGIPALAAPDFGDPVAVHDQEVPVFWACGVTSQEACRRALAEGRIPWYASHAPGHMLVGDLRDEDLREHDDH